MAALAASAVAAPSALAQSTLTPNEVVDRIKKKLADEGVIWQRSNFDGFHLGDPNVAVTGIAVTFQPGLSVLQRASAAGKNFVICHESTFWDGFDPVIAMKDDPVAKAKIRFAEEHKMAVWRIHDHWHRRKPDPIFQGLAAKLDWSEYYQFVRSGQGHYAIPAMSLDEVARHIQEKLGTKNVVVVGDPKLQVTTIGDCIHNLVSVLPALHNYDVALVGETPEHDTFEYVRDAMALGEKKAVVMISHEGLEEWGMVAAVDWLKPIVPEVPIEWVPTGDPFVVPPGPRLIATNSAQEHRIR
jgi:putative NIF3 family GTP cyclohydrolase 1 type 2